MQVREVDQTGEGRRRLRVGRGLHGGVTELEELGRVDVRSIGRRCSVAPQEGMGQLTCRQHRVGQHRVS